MANLHVTIVIRTTSPEGKRGWIRATGKKDPKGPLYLRYCSGSKPRYTKAGNSFDEAEAAKIRLERKLKAQSQGFVIPEEVPTNAKELHRCKNVVDAYLKHLRNTTKRNGRRYSESSIKARQSDLDAFLKFSGRVYVEQITRADIVRYKDALFAEVRASDTVLNKLMTITVWLKHNQVVPITGLLKSTDWPIQKKTYANPYRKGEIDAMMKVAGEHKLLLRFFLGTGMRKSEIAHAEKSDLNPESCTISVRSKPHWNWETKTMASVREIPISPALLGDLQARPGNGLLFPNTATEKPERHLERTIEAIATKAGVVAPLKADWCHRWRDTFATMQVRAKIHDHRDIARMLGHADLKTMDLYAEFVRMDSDEARKAAEVSDPYANKLGPQLVRVG